MSRHELPTWVWNKGIAARCDRRIPDEFPDGETYVPVEAFAGADVDSGPTDLIAHPERFDDLGGGELVWVRGSWLRSFVERVLPRVRGDFVLVTGDTDSSLPSAAPDVATALLRSPYLAHWYAQNYDGSAPRGRMSPVPIGLDFHTRSRRPAWGQSIATPGEQAAELDEVVAALAPVTERTTSIYVDLWSAHTAPPPMGARLPESRVQVAALLRAHPFVVAEPRMSRLEMWRRRGQYAFSVSPHGNGLDAHRTWEGLALGQVVLVPSSSLDPMFEGLRAFPLGRWQDLTPDRLARWLFEAATIPHPAPALGSDEWVARMRRSARRP